MWDSNNGKGLPESFWIGIVVGFVIAACFLTIVGVRPCS
jgi:hypothetical protein